MTAAILAGAAAAAGSQSDRSATWTSASRSGEVAGDWYVEGDMRCIRFTTPGDQDPNPECTNIFVFADGYLSVFADGSINGFVARTPL